MFQINICGAPIHRDAPSHGAVISVAPLTGVEYIRDTGDEYLIDDADPLVYPLPNSIAVAWLLQL